MDEESQTPAVETETLVVTDDVVDETPETPAETPETETLTVEQLQAQLAAERAKTAKAVRAEQALRARAQTAETELTGFKSAAETAEAERVANLGLTEQLTLAQQKAAAAEARALAAEAKATDMRIESDLGAAGFLSGLEGDAKAAQLQTLKALTGLSLVQDDGQFSIDLFGQRFAGMKPAAAVVVAEDVVPAVVDLGGKTPSVKEVKGSRKNELLKELEAATTKGERFRVLQIQSELSTLK